MIVKITLIYLYSFLNIVQYDDLLYVYSVK